MPTIETARRDGAPRAAIASAGRDGGTTCLLSLTRYRISSVGRRCNAKVPSDVETCPNHVRNMSVARLISVMQLTFDPRLSHALDYMDSCTPSIKFQFLLRFKISVRSQGIANNIG